MPTDNLINSQLDTILKNNYTSVFNEEVKKIEPLAAHGSNRQYFRLSGETAHCIAAYNNDFAENSAFVTLSRHFYKNNLPVPQIYGEDLKQNIYLLEDLGDTTLYDFLSAKRTGDQLPPNVFDLYKKTLKILAKFQIDGAKGLDFSICYPRAAFDKQSIMWDLNYFKYYFLKFKNIPFNEQDLENDFHTFADFLLTTDQDYFLYRDFQSRNIMINNDNLYFIDYQGGRRGALHYDVASLLYDAKANLTEKERQKLLEYYMEQIEENYFILDKKQFMQYYYSYAIMRIMQAFGAYGFRGYYEKKEHFIKSVPFAVKNLKYLLNNVNLAVNVPTLYETWQKIIKI